MEDDFPTEFDPKLLEELKRAAAAVRSAGSV